MSLFWQDFGSKGIKTTIKYLSLTGKSSSFMITFPYFYKSQRASLFLLDIYLNKYNNYSHNTVFSMSSIVGTKNPFGFFI